MGKANECPKRRGRQNRRKGGEYELEVAKGLQEFGLTARKIPQSGAAEGFPGDIEVFAGFDDGKTRFQGECKRRTRLPTLLQSLGDNDFLAMRQDRGGTLIVLRLDTFAGLLQ